MAAAIPTAIIIPVVVRRVIVPLEGATVIVLIVVGRVIIPEQGAAVVVLVVVGRIVVAVAAREVILIVVGRVVVASPAERSHLVVSARRPAVSVVVLLRHVDGEGPEAGGRIPPLQGLDLDDPPTPIVA